MNLKDLCTNVICLDEKSNRYEIVHQGVCNLCSYCAGFCNFDGEVYVDCDRHGTIIPSLARPHEDIPMTFADMCIYRPDLAVQVMKKSS